MIYFSLVQYVSPEDCLSVSNYTLHTAPKIANRQRNQTASIGADLRHLFRSSTTPVSLDAVTQKELQHRRSQSTTS
jgi:hypothetical protein